MDGDDGRMQSDRPSLLERMSLNPTATFLCHKASCPD